MAPHFEHPSGQQLSPLSYSNRPLSAEVARTTKIAGMIIESRWPNGAPEQDRAEILEHLDFLRHLTNTAHFKEVVYYEKYMERRMFALALAFENKLPSTASEHYTDFIGMLAEVLTIGDGDEYGRP